MLNKKALAATAAADKLYVEDVFSTYLYTGTGSALTITNGIDLSGEGGLVWIKQRSLSYTHALVDTVRGTDKVLCSNNTNAEQTGDPGFVTQFNSNGFAVGDQGRVNLSTYDFASWTFRQAEKFFDVVTWTGNGTGSRAISHNLGSTPGCIILKRTDTADDWYVVHRGATDFSYYGVLNSTAAFAGPDASGISSVNSTSFTVSSYYNGSGATWVAYLFAHDAGGFGDSGSDNVISCGSFTTDGSGNATVSLGYEPQWVMYKKTNAAGSWTMIDVMRGMTFTTSEYLFANLSDAAFSGTTRITPVPNGFNIVNGIEASSSTYIYIAIRRGPMKTPTTGTIVFEPLARSGTGAAATVTTTVRPDGVLQNWRSGGLGSASHFFYDRLRGVAKALFTDTTDAESTQTATGINAFNNLSYGIAGAGSMNNGSATYVDYIFTRAPGFFDVVCYTGTGSATTFSHNLGVTPELMIVKCRTTSPTDWAIYNSYSGATKYLRFRDLAEGTASSLWNNTTPTSSVFTVGDSSWVNASNDTYVAYLFATLAGVSKVGSYTGNGSSQTINCGFTGGARFVLIKRTDSTGDWVVFDSARGIVSGNDPYLELNTQDAEVTDKDAVDTDNTGFVVNETTGPNINTNGASYIFLAVA
jgi:hypothetical protein